MKDENQFIKEISEIQKEITKYRYGLSQLKKEHRNFVKLLGKRKDYTPNELKEELTKLKKEKLLLEQKREKIQNEIEELLETIEEKLL